MDDEYGVTVDGEGDFVSLGPNSAEGWAVDGDFTISFMFTNQACRIPVRTAVLLTRTAAAAAAAAAAGSAFASPGPSAPNKDERS